MHICEFEGSAYVLQNVFAENTEQKWQNCSSQMRKMEGEYWQ
jgi:hypothetical protein